MESASRNKLDFGHFGAKLRYSLDFRVHDYHSLIASLTREHGGWEQGCLRIADERSRGQRLVPAQGAGAKHWTESAPRFPATKSPGTTAKDKKSRPPGSAGWRAGLLPELYLRKKTVSWQH